MFAGTIRKFEPQDLEAVEEIFDLYWSGDFRDRLSERLKTEAPEFKWIVAEESGEVVGVAASRAAPERMKQYAKADKVVEFYVAAVKYKGKGIGKALREFGLKAARDDGYHEVVFFSGETHQDSWAFHDQSDFKRVGEAVAPGGERGQVWLMGLK
jgi:L-amino acid N-acyltransferase YncA